MKLFFWILAMASVSLGAVLFKTPRRVIEAQIEFYRRINWKMEPISWEKEIRNTRWMGALALLCGILIILIAWLKPACAEDEENRELGIEMRGVGKPTIQEAASKSQGKLNKYDKAKKEVIAIFDSSVNKSPATPTKKWRKE